MLLVVAAKAGAVRWAFLHEDFNGWFYMWCDFVWCALAATLFLALPGVLLCRAFRFDATASLCCSFMAATALYAVLAMVLPLMGVKASWVVLLCLALALAACAWAVSHFCARGAAVVLTGDALRRVCCGRLSGNAGLVVLYGAIGIAVVSVIFVCNISSPDAFWRAWDNVHHLSSVRAFMESGNFSSLTTTSYATAADAAVTPFPGEAMFYPSAWHCLVAMVAQAVGAQPALAANAVNAVLMGIVLSLSMFALLRRLLPASLFVLACGAACVLAFGTFPWGFLTFGPLYPNLMSYALLPAAAFAFLTVFDRGIGCGRRAANIAFFVIGLVSLALSQPNAVFSLGVFLVPYCVMQSHRGGVCLRDKKGWKTAPLLCAIACIAAIAAFWFLMYHMPFLQGVIEYNWPAKADPSQAFASLLMMSHGYAPVQLILAAFVLTGLAIALRRPEYRWFAWSYLFASAIFFVDMAFNGAVKHFIAGFWYTDQLRTGSMAAIFAVPLAALGAHRLADIAALAFDRLVCVGAFRGKRPSVMVRLGCAAVLFAAIFYPSFDMSGRFYVNTAFGDISARITAQTDPAKVHYLDEEEREFVRRACEIVPSDQVLLNRPNDGSVFLYGADGVRTYYRYLTGYEGGWGESSQSVLIRKSLCDIAENAEVRDAVKSVGAQYVLNLDAGYDGDKPGEGGAKRRFLPSDGIRDEWWSGISSIDDDTPGFEVVLSEDDMRLYKITM